MYSDSILNTELIEILMHWCMEVALHYCVNGKSIPMLQRMRMQDFF